MQASGLLLTLLYSAPDVRLLRQCKVTKGRKQASVTSIEETFLSTSKAQSLSLSKRVPAFVKVWQSFFMVCFYNSHEDFRSSILQFLYVNENHGEGLGCDLYYQALTSEYPSERGTFAPWV